MAEVSEEGANESRDGLKDEKEDAVEGMNAESHLGWSLWGCGVHFNWRPGSVDFERRVQLSLSRQAKVKMSQRGVLS